ncbi:MAG: hypothetical protein ACYC0B_06040 [Gemmatimonadaceae bacterium]
MVRGVGLALALLPVALAAQGAGARDGEPCEIVVRGVVRGDDSTRMQIVTAASGARHTFVGGGVDATCAGRGNRLLADSAEHYADRGLLILFHNVRYTEKGMRLTADRMTYNTVEERLLAEGNVRALSASGTRFHGPRVEYFPDKPGVRPVSRWVATGRPFVRMSPSESGAPTVRPPSATDSLAAVAAMPSPPRGDSAAMAAVRGDSVDLTANYVVSENDSLMWASGDVVIERADMIATADSAMMDDGIEFARLMRKPVIVGRGERPFTLDGDIIDLWSKARKLERVVAAGQGRVVSDSLVLTSDTIDMRLLDQRMERVFAWGARSRADAPAQRIDADSLDILMPGQRLREVHAIGDARATSRADSATVVTDEPDWIRGDTLIALFDTVAIADSTSQPRMREVLAEGGARSFYQLAPSDGTRGVPDISYNRGRVIKVSFAEGEMTKVDVVERASGIFLESAPADTSRRTPPAPPGARARP